MSDAREDQTIVCVLGMSRSGTSLTTRMLNLAGVHLGPKVELLGGDLRQLACEGERVLEKARNSNPEGHWEHYRLMRLNERILRALGGNWREPPPLPRGWESSPHLDGLREEARGLLAESFGGHRLWGWKDPRNSLTLPFWQRQLPRMHYVICLRNPLDVAASLQRRDGMPLKEGVELWLTYLAAALVNTSGQLRLLVSYEGYFGDPQGTAARLARFTVRDGALEGGEAQRQLEAAIDPSLWRNRTSVGDAIDSEFISREAASLYLIAVMLETIAVGGAGAPVADEAALNTAADLYARRFLDGIAQPSAC